VSPVNRKVASRKWWLGFISLDGPFSGHRQRLAPVRQE
jgi:hypothetical protein